MRTVGKNANMNIAECNLFAPARLLIDERGGRAVAIYGKGVIYAHLGAKNSCEERLVGSRQAKKKPRMSWSFYTPTVSRRAATLILGDEPG